MPDDDLILRGTAAIMALAPAMLFIGVVCLRKPWRDSRRLIWIAYGLGFCVAIPTAALVAIYAPLIAGIGDFRVYAAAVALIEAAVPEETAKFLIILFFVMRHEDLRRPADAMILTICMALGFATIENLYYVIGSEDWTDTAMLRAVTAVPMHATIAVVMGYYAAQILLHPERYRRLLVCMWFWPFLLHGLYDYPVFAIYRLLEIQDSVPNAQLIEFQLIFAFAFLAAIAAALAAIQVIAGQSNAMRPLAWHTPEGTRIPRWLLRTINRPRRNETPETPPAELTARGLSNTGQ
jgi:RsiW-degrading membrane proteinase PrsW (M82 family)